MKHKIITIIAFLAVMVALTGAASAANSFYATDVTHVKLDPIYVKNGANFTLALQIETLNQFDLGHDSPNAITRAPCFNLDNSPSTCSSSNSPGSDVVLTKLIDPINVSKDPTIVDGQVRIEVNVPLDRKAGVAYPVTSATALFTQTTVSHTVSIILLGGEISGKKCNDLDRNGICGETEPGLSNWTINLKDENGTIVATTQTDVNGNYTFMGPTDLRGTHVGFRGTFTVEEVLKDGWTQTGPPAPGTHTVTVDANNATGLDFANIFTLSISGMKCNDDPSKDGLCGVGDAPLANWTIKLAKPDGTTLTTQTGADGKYKFTNLTAGTYTVSEVLKDGWEQTGPKPVPPGTWTVTLVDHDETGKDFANVPVRLNISGMKCNDENSTDGLCGEGDTPLPDWTIVLTKPDGTTMTMQTGTDGKYKFSDLPAGTYTISEVLKNGWNQTGPKPVPPGTWTVTLVDHDETGKDFANVPVRVPCVNNICKVVGWGTLGNKAAPELTFKIFAFTKFMPKGTVEAEDDAGNKIRATEINSVITNKNLSPMTGEIKGKAMFNNEGPFDFVVMVTDGGQPPSPYVGKDTFDISISAKNYHKSGTLTSGDLEVVK